MNIWFGKKGFSYDWTLLVHILLAQSSESSKRPKKVLSMDILLIQVNEIRAF